MRDGDDLPGHLVGLGAAAGTGFLHRRPAGKSGGVPHSQPDSGNGLGGCHHTDDAYYDAGGAPAGLYPHCFVQGAPGAGRDYPAHHLVCFHPGGHAFSRAYLPRCGRPTSLRFEIDDPGRRRRDHGKHLQSAGVRVSHVSGPQRARLPRGFRHQPAVRLGRGGDQPPHRHDVRLPGSGDLL